MPDEEKTIRFTPEEYKAHIESLLAVAREEVQGVILHGATMALEGFADALEGKLAEPDPPMISGMTSEEAAGAIAGARSIIRSLRKAAANIRATTPAPGTPPVG